jgi:hypothetical protein
MRPEQKDTRNNDILRQLIDRAEIGGRGLTREDALRLINAGQSRPYSYNSFRAYFVCVESARWRRAKDPLIERARIALDPYLLHTKNDLAFQREVGLEFIDSGLLDRGNRPLVREIANEAQQF